MAESVEASLSVGMDSGFKLVVESVDTPPSVETDAACVCIVGAAPSVVVLKAKDNGKGRKGHWKHGCWKAFKMQSYTYGAVLATSAFKVPSD